jgi:purine/pyrimidine-nucleoside phosphorylase
MTMTPTEFRGVTAIPKANVYFDGKVVSHTLIFSDGSKKTIGLIYPGKFHFGTEKAERMEIVDGQCAVQVDGQPAVACYGAGQAFEVPAKSGFDIEVTTGICQYVCSFVG